MNSRGWWVCALLVASLQLGSALAMDADPKLKDPQQQAIYAKLTNEVRCLVCQNQTIADSTAPLAADLRHEIRELVEAGQSEAEIKEFLLERYGDFVLYRPRFMPSTAVLWLAPLLLLAVGVFAARIVVRRRASLPVPDDEADDQPAADGSAQ